MLWRLRVEGLLAERAGSEFRATKRVFITGRQARFPIIADPYFDAEVFILGA